MKHLLKSTTAMPLPVLVIAGARGLRNTFPADCGSGTPSKGRSVRGTALRTRRRPLLAGIAVLCVWICGWALVSHRGSTATVASALPSDFGEQQLAERQQFLQWQQAVRRALVRQRAVAAARPSAGWLPNAPPRIALLFLARGNMPLEPVWREFFATAAQVSGHLGPG